MPVIYRFKARETREEIFARACALGHGLPKPVLEHRFHPERRWRFDIAWPDAKDAFGRPAPLAIEIQGGVWTGGKHGRGSGIIKDMEKSNAATLLGWRVLFTVPSKLCHKDTFDMVKQALLTQP